ncbi:MAG: BREX-1 system phosphatase PglZ type A [Candidatus Tenebribacter davisii]|nr:BREX-1 system phosphatase PglZ type A [Candidatus Tenebribacter davisii]
MNQQVINTLKRLFDKHRIIFWFDGKQELRADFEALDLPGIEKIEIHNNEFAIKHRVLREEPKQKFLLYHEGTQPEDIKNWLLDVFLANGEFRTDQDAIWLNELDLDHIFIDIVRDHKEFFQSEKRKQDLKKLLKKDDTHSRIRQKMLAVCAGSESMFEEILETLLSEQAAGKDARIKLIKRCSLDNFLWEQLQRFYAYKSDKPGIHDFAIELFKSCHAMGFDQEHQLTSEALVFLKRWKDSRRHSNTFEQISKKCEEILNIEQDLNKRDYRDLIDMDYFQLIDKKILSDLVKHVMNNTISRGSCMSLVRQRRQSYWYEEFQPLYEAIDYAVQFVYALEEVKLDVTSLTEGAETYTKTWYKIDQLYRKFTYYAGSSGQSSLLGPLNEHIENLYSNNYLLKLNDNWQQKVDDSNTWQCGMKSQTQFFSHWIKPFLKNNKKVFVIISDAFRYEIADEFLKLIQQEDRYMAQLEPMFGVLPSYTQLGMAALLPHSELEIADDGSGKVLVDGQSSQGTDNRAKILKNAVKGVATAIQSEDFMKMNWDEYRSFARSFEVVYLYHNHIDATGDKRDTEKNVFKAVEDTMQELVKLVKKLTNANANNIIITADHGFIYQNRPIDESDFSAAEIDKDNIMYRDRRFLIGKELKEHKSLKKYNTSELGIAGELQIQISKSINRLRLQGSGSRFVHGGASLQEVIIPVLSINKKRKSDITNVDVDIMRGTTNIISSGQLSVAFYQVDPVTDKVQPRVLRTGIYNKEGRLISDSHILKFDYISDNAREREIKVRFVLSRLADEANGKEVSLRLEEQIADTSHYKEYKSIQYTIRRSFTTDFDF